MRLIGQSIVLLTVIMSIVIITEAFDTDKPKCLIIRNKKYVQEVIKTKVRGPYQLAIDYNKNTLFFSYTISQKQLIVTQNLTDIPTFQIGYIKLETNNKGIVNGIPGGFATTANYAGNVYMGGEKGLYEYNYETNTAELLKNVTNASIWSLFYRNGLYFTTYPEGKAYYYKFHGHIINLTELDDTGKVEKIALTKRGKTVFTNSSGLYTYDSWKGKVFKGDVVVEGFTTDYDDNVYFATSNKIYFIDDKRGKLEELITIPNIFGIAVQRDGNIIYSNEDSIIRLKPRKRCTLEKQSKSEIHKLTTNGTIISYKI